MAKPVLSTDKSQLPSSPNYSYTPPPFCSLLAGEAREKGRCDNGTNVVALGCTINRHPTVLVQGDCSQSPTNHPEGVRLMDFRSSIGVDDKSTPHGTGKSWQQSSLKFTWINAST